ncbi:hypothetical protein OG234_13255 [Streptomyces sp. NBC_01420]|uniref:hypothetical protein n=1 Tax=Streptomyces sp. NBC_01420 TaxID=2903858 RepID=UPI003253889D
MDTSSADRILNDYVQGTPGAVQASLHDPEFVANLHTMRDVLTHLETALAAEGLDDRARHRVGTRLTLACLGAEQPNPARRLAEQEAGRVAVTPDVVRPWMDHLRL